LEDRGVDQTKRRERNSEGNKNNDGKYKQDSVAWMVKKQGRTCTQAN